MKPPHKLAIVGAGGITCHLLSLLTLDHDIVLIDGDKFEPHNSKRQWPAFAAAGGDGQNKAEFLANHHASGNREIHAIPSYMEGNSIVNNPDWQGVEMIIGCVDNNESRKIICAVADQQFIPAILCGNEEYMGEAHLFLPGYYDPFDHIDFGPMTKAPFSCTADENAASAPQTSTANFLAAAAGAHILMAWCKAEDRKNLIVHSLLDVRATSKRTRLREVPQEASLASA